MKTIFLRLTILVCSFFLFSCGDNNKDTPAESEATPAAASCKLPGTWVRCGENGSVNSTKLSMVFTDTTLHEKVEDFSASNLCEAPNTGEFTIDATYTLGAVGASTSLSGGTDLDITSTTDDLGCGVGNPVYTVIQFNSECTQFFAIQTGPTCDPNVRGTTLDPKPFTKL